MHRLLVKVGDATDKSVYPEKKPRRSPKARLLFLVMICKLPHDIPVNAILTIPTEEFYQKYTYIYSAITFIMHSLQSNERRKRLPSPATR